MNIPLKVIKIPQLVHSSSLANHQLFAKQAMKLSTKSKSTPNNIKQSKDDIFQWFFSLNTFQRLKVISIQNNWLVKMLYQMLFIYKFEKRIEFQPTEDNDEFYRSKNPFPMNKYSNTESSLSEYYYIFYEPVQPPRIDCLKQELDNSKMYKLLKKETEFISNIRFITLDEVNDTLTLSLNLLNNETSFKELFILFSESQCFDTQINAIYNSNFKVFNFSIPEWSIQKGKMTMCQLIVFYFEQSISSHYRYYMLNKECLYNSPSDSKLRDLLEDNANIENFLHEESGSNKEKFMSLIDYNKIIDSIRSNIKLKDMIADYKSQADKVMKDYQKRTTPVISRHLNSMERNDIEGTLASSFYKSIPLFVDMITFIDSKILFLMDNFVYQKVFKMLLDLYSKKNASELINELSKIDQEKTTKKKKKNKKKKKKKIEDDDTQNEDKDTHDEDTGIKEKTIAIKQEQVQERNNITTENENQAMPKKEKNKKKKELFLYATKEIKTQNQIKKKEPNNNQDKDKIDNTITNFNHNRTISIVSQVTKENAMTPSTITINLENNHIKNIQEQNVEIKQESSSIILGDKISISISNPVINNYYFVNQQSPTHYNQLQPGINIHDSPYPCSHFRFEQQPLFPFRYPYFSPQQMYMNQYSNQVPYVKPSFPLFDILHNEIEAFAKNVAMHLFLLKEYKIKYIRQLSTLIHSSLQDKYDIQLVNYGSFVTGLGIESSDIDIAIKFKPKEAINTEPNISSSIKIENVINQLAKTFNQKTELFDYVKPIYSASVPVLKVQCDISNLIEHSVLNRIKNNFWFDLIEIEKIKLDVTVFEIPNSKYSNSIPPELAVEYVDNSIIKFPEIKPLLNVLKRYMQIEKLNLSFNGGISSYSLFLLMLAFLKSNQHKNTNIQQHPYSLSLGKTLIEFFGYYSSFDFSSFCIDVNAINPFISLKSKHEGGMLILDPFTSLNVAKSSFRLEEIKKAFKKAHYMTIKHTSEMNYNHFPILKELFGVKNEEQ